MRDRLNGATSRRRCEPLPARKITNEEVGQFGRLIEAEHVPGVENGIADSVSLSFET